MQTLPDITDLPAAPDLSSASTLKERITNFLNALPGMVTQYKSLIAAQNILSGQINTAATSIATSESNAASSALIAQGAANFKGVWSGATAYTTGQSVQGSDGVFYIALQNSTNQNPTTTTGYWVVDAPIGAVGNILSPDLFLNLKSPKAVRANFQEAFMFERSTGACRIVPSTGRYVWDASYTGTATSGSLWNLNNTGAGWTAGALEDYVVKITTGSVVEYRWVVGNDATSISFDRPVSTPVTASTTYALAKPRFETGGLLYEGPSTNLLTYSEQLWNTTYWAVGTTLANFFTVTQDNTIASIYGTADGKVAKFVAGATPNSLFLRKTGLSLSSGVAHTESIFIYVPSQAGVTSFSVSTDYNDADSGSYETGTTFDRWVRLKSTAYLSASRSQLDFNILVNGSTPSTGFTFYVMGADLEASPFASSYIPTTSVALTRNADILQVQAAGILRMHNSDLTMIVDFDILGVHPSYPYPKTVYAVNSADNSQSVQLLVGYNGAAQSYAYKSPTGSATFNITAGAKYRHAVAFKGDKGVFYKNGVPVEIKTGYPTTNFAALDKLYIGSQNGTSHFFYGHISTIRIHSAYLNALENGLA